MTEETLGTIFPLLLIVLAFWLLVIRPARKRQQEMTRIQNSVVVGSEVMLGSGIFGTVTSIGDETITVSIAPGTEIKVVRQAVARVVDGAAPGTTGEISSDAPEQP